MLTEILFQLLHWAGIVLSPALWLLFGMSFLLLCKWVKQERFPQLYYATCLLCAALSLIIFYAHFMEIVIAHESGAKYEMEAFKHRMMGPYWYVFVLQYIFMFIPVLLFYSFFRRSPLGIMVIATCGLIAIHLERIIIMITTAPQFSW